MTLIERLNNDAMVKAVARLDSLTKPLGSLGRLEDLVKQLAGISGKAFPDVDRKTVVIMCADNGVVDEGVSSCPKSVTASVTQNFTRGITGINIFSGLTGAEIVVVDIGVDADLESGSILNRKIRKGTWNIARGPAMTRQEAIRAIETGIEIVSDLKDMGTNLLGTGEMGVGNTTTSSAVACVLTGVCTADMVGRGAGLSSEAYELKKLIVEKAININNPDPADPLDVLAKLGGFDIAGLVGCFIGAAVYRIPILLDGFISSVAALVASKMHPEIRNYLIPSHGSAEPGTAAVMKA
jgi:nicotinate-nucleotide--dimethylbenzimidazole phosphoribosyltransferase